MSDWKRCTLANLGEIVGGATPSTKNESFYGGDIAWITPKDLSTFHGRFISRGERNITADGLKNSSARLLPPHSILFTSRAPIGYVAIAENEVCTNQGFKSIAPNDHTDYLFLYYLLVHNRDRIENMGSGTTFKEVSGSVMKQIEVFVPSDKAEQRAIAETLGALDDKIENNSKINHHLEQMLRSLFKSWFIDFDPFGGDQPSDWQEQPLEKFISFQEGPGIRNWQYVPQDGAKFINIRCIQDGDLRLDTANMISSEEANGKYRHFMLNEWDVIVSTSGTLGRYAVVRKEHLPLCLNTSVIRFVPKKSFSHFSYMLGYLSSSEFYDHLQTKASGSVQANFGPMHLRQITMLIPSDIVLGKYHNLVFPLFQKVIENRRESEQLARLRDSLLPRLMSGELSIANLDDAK